MDWLLVGVVVVQAVVYWVGYTQKSREAWRYRDAWLDAETRLNEAWGHTQQMTSALARANAENSELQQALEHTLRTIEAEAERVH